MRVEYDPQSDILILHIAKGTVDHAERSGPFIMHSDEKGVPLLLEVLDAKTVVEKLASGTIKGGRSKKEVLFS
jgi:uncharacterized protein YuzE